MRDERSRQGRGRRRHRDRRHRRRRSASWRRPSPTIPTSAPARRVDRTRRRPRWWRSRSPATRGTQARRRVERLRDDCVPAAFGSVDARSRRRYHCRERRLLGSHRPMAADRRGLRARVELPVAHLVFRSVVLPRTRWLLNLLSVGAAYGLLVLVFQQDRRRPARVPAGRTRRAWVPVFLFSVLFALSMDYHVFLLTRIRSATRQRRHDDAVIHGVAATGRIITGAALIIVVVFAGFAAGELWCSSRWASASASRCWSMPPSSGWCWCPPCMVLLGRWNWYLPSGWTGCPSCTSRGTPFAKRHRQRCPPMISCGPVASSTGLNWSLAKDPNMCLDIEYHSSHTGGK